MAVPALPSTSRLLAVAVALPVLLVVAAAPSSTAAPVVALTAATGPTATRPSATAPSAAGLPTAVTGFAPGVEISPRLACGAPLATIRTDASGVLHLPGDLLAHTAPGRHRLLVSGPATGTAPATGNVVVTVPRTEIIGVRVDGAHHVSLDPGAPAPHC